MRDAMAAAAQCKIGGGGAATPCALCLSCWNQHQTAYMAVPASCLQILLMLDHALCRQIHEGLRDDAAFALHTAIAMQHV
jgi:hypothetical protein